MAGLTRKLIKDAAKDAGIEIPNEMIDAIIDAHVESRDAAVAKAVEPLSEQIEAAKAGGDQDEFKTKWEQEHEAFETFKGEVEAEKLNGKKQSEIKNLLKELSVSEKRHDIILKALSPDLGTIELDKDGKIKDVDKLKTSIATDWAEFIETTERKPSPTPTPPIKPTGDNKEAEVIARVRAAMGLPEPTDERK
jgi:hypothetical protein